MRNRKLALFIGIWILLLAGCGRKEAQMYLDTESTSEATATLEVERQEIDSPTEESLCYVYICGAVVSPGVYALKNESRIYEVIAKAGGLREDAGASSINQAEVISDGQMITVPTVEEAKELENTALADDKAEIGNTGGIGKVNLNTAGMEQLMTIPGVGESKAKSIISYREEKGRFDKIEDIMNITGIKEGMFSKMKDDITVD